MTTTPAPPVNAWILDPVSSAILFVGEEAKIGGLLQRALVHIENGRPLLELAERVLAAAGQTQGAKGLRSLIEAAPIQEQWAADLRNSDYAPLNSHSLVAIWGAFETAVEDTIKAVLAKNPSAVGTMTAAGVRVSNAKIANPATEESLRYLYRKLQDAVAVDYDIAQTLENMLGVFSLSVISPQHKSALLAANALRNAIAHRRGYIDEKAVRQAPALAPLLGTICVVTRAEYLKYHEGISAALVTLLGSITSSRYVAKT
jgi:hypothetical protein